MPYYVNKCFINTHLEELDSSIKAFRVVDNDRFFSCTPKILNPCFTLVKPLLENTHPCLIFGADETHLDPKLKKKYVVPQEVREFITKNQSGHFSVMLAHNCVGEAQL